MKQRLNKLKDGVLIGLGAGIGLSIIVGLTYAYTSVSSGDTLTATMWNDLQAKVDGIFTDGSGNVGIGTTTPVKRLHVASTGTPTYVEIQKTDGVTGRLGVGDSTMAMEVDGTNDLTFYTNSSEKMRVKSDGNVGIGTNTPTSTLDVNGKIRGNATYSYDSSSTTITYSSLSTIDLPDIQTSIVVQAGDVIKVDLACNLRNDTSGGVTYMRAGAYSGDYTTKVVGNRITSNGGTNSVWTGGNSVGIYKANIDGTLTFGAQGHVSGGTASAVYCNIVAYVIGKE